MHKQHDHVRTTTQMRKRVTTAHEKNNMTS
jgi:hypothetical protein